MKKPLRYAIIIVFKSSLFLLLLVLPRTFILYIFINENIYKYHKTLDTYDFINQTFKTIFIYMCFILCHIYGKTLLSINKHNPFTCI